MEDQELIQRLDSLSQKDLNEYLKTYQVSEDIIRRYAAKVNWNNISFNQTLSEGFIREYTEKVNWKYISSCQILSEPFIREFADKVDWRNLTVEQKLSVYI